MHFSVLAVIPALLLFAVASPITEVTVENGGAGLSRRALVAGCTECFLDSSQGLQCWCATRSNGNTAQTNLSLNKCVSNDNGHLRSADNGNFAGSCRSISIDGSSTITATCSNAGGGETTSTLDLNTVISNDNGYLRCFEHDGCCKAGTCRNPPGCT